MSVEIDFRKEDEYFGLGVAFGKWCFIVVFLIWSLEVSFEKRSY